MGHDGGDQLLRAVAERIRDSVRPGDTVARFGGDEFTILFEEVADAAGAREAAARTLTALSLPFELDDGEVFVSASVGVALSSTGHDTPALLLRNADAAMYRAKERGRAGIELYDQHDDPWTVRRLRTGNDLHRALERNEFELHYQPFVDLHTTTMLGLEALVRWRHPTRGLLAPGEFIDLAEDSGLIVPLGYWVIGEACRQASPMTQYPRGTINPESSARSMNSPGARRPRVGWRQRTSASSPSMVVVCKSTKGW